LRVDSAAQLPVEAFTVAVFPGTSWLNGQRSQRFDHLVPS
jgi:hypothetical protein